MEYQLCKHGKIVDINNGKLHHDCHECIAEQAVANYLSLHSK